jgi:hypothetical protein
VRAGASRDIGRSAAEPGVDHIQTCIGAIRAAKFI